MAFNQTHPRGISVISGSQLEAFELDGNEPELGNLSIVNVQGQPFRLALRLETLAPARNASSVQIRTTTTRQIEAGDVLLARFWIRCVGSDTGEAFTTCIFDLARPGGDKCVELSASADGQWQEYCIPFRALRCYEPGDARICFRAGFDRQAIEIGGIELVSFGKTVHVDDLPRTRITYAGREPDAEWRAAALDRIETIRKGDLRVQVVDRSGRPVAGAQIRARMLRHEFGFGSAVAAEELLGAAPDNRHYREAFEKLFNRAVFENDLKWPETYRGVPQRVHDALTWLRERRIAVRGHCLVWPGWRWLPRDLQQYKESPEELRRRAAAHVTDLVSLLRGQLIHWDVINEPYSNHDLMTLLGKEVMLDWFKLARQADPDCKLFLNDYGILESGGIDRAHQDHFYNTIRWLIQHGAPIDGVGIQSHFGLCVTPPIQMLGILDRFSEFGLPIESTEVSLNVADRELQADFMRDYLIAVFSHPNVHGVMLWGFWEGRHWRPDAALYDNNWRLRPHGQVWIDLVHRQWKTDETTATDDLGQAVVRGFLGEYELTVGGPAGRSKCVHTDLPRDGRQVSIVFE